MISTMNDTKWNELQKAMINLNSLSPKWRTKRINNRYISSWDSEWYYHFSEGGFKDIEWVELQINNEEQNNKVLSKLKTIHLPGIKTKLGYKVFGYVEKGSCVDYI